MRRLRATGRRRDVGRVDRGARAHGLGDGLTKLVGHLLMLLGMWRQRLGESMLRLCGINSNTSAIPKSCLLFVVCRSRRRNSSLHIPTDGRSGGGASDVAGVAGVVDVARTLSPLTATQPAPEPKKYQDKEDSAADGAANDRPRRLRGSG